LIACIPRRGRRFARVVRSTSDRTISSPGPPFRVIANRTDVTATSLRTFLTTTHSTTVPPFTMPNPRLSDRQLDAVIEYILSLRGHSLTTNAARRVSRGRRRPLHAPRHDGCCID